MSTNILEKEKVEPAASQTPGLINSATVPSTAFAVGLVVFGSAGADQMSVRLLNSAPGSLSFSAIALFSAIISLFVTFNGVKLNLVWRCLLWPVNFCVLVALAVSANNLYQSALAPSATNAGIIQVLPGATK